MPTLTTNERTAIANEIEAQIILDTDSERVLTAITDKIASVNPSLSGLTLAAIAAQVRTELADELARIDAAITSRLASAGYTAPDNLVIAAIASSVSGIPTTPLLSNDVRLDYLDASVSSRFLSGTYVAPDNAGIAAIEAAVADLALGGATTVKATVAVSSVVAAGVSSGLLTMQTYYTMSQTVKSSTTSDLSAATKLWFAIKSTKQVSDAQSLIFIEQTDGLTYVNKVAYSTPGNGSITVTGESGNWNVNISLEEAVTALFNSYDGSTFAAEIKALVGSDTVPVWNGNCTIVTGVIRAIA
jgi:hypothetical protein